MDELVEPTGDGMRLTEGGRRLLPIASQMVSPAHEATEAIRWAQGATELLRVVADPLVAEFGGPMLVDAFAARSADVEASIAAASPSHHRLVGPSSNDPSSTLGTVIRSPP